MLVDHDMGYDLGYKELWEKRHQRTNSAKPETGAIERALPAEE